PWLRELPQAAGRHFQSCSSAASAWQRPPRLKCVSSTKTPHASTTGAHPVVLGLFPQNQNQHLCIAKQPTYGLGLRQAEVMYITASARFGVELASSAGRSFVGRAWLLHQIGLATGYYWPCLPTTSRDFCQSLSAFAFTVRRCWWMSIVRSIIFSFPI